LVHSYQIFFQVNDGEQVDTSNMFKEKLHQLGEMNKGEKLVLFFFIVPQRNLPK